MHRYLIASATAVIATGLSASIADASVSIVNAKLTNTYSFDSTTTVPFPPAGPTVVLDSSSPGNAFSSLDARNVGVEVNINPSTGGFFRVSDNATGNLAAIGAANGYIGSASGLVHFTADAPFSFGKGTPANEATMFWNGGGITVTNDASGAFLKLDFTAGNTPALSGTLPTVNAPAGDYTVSLGLTSYRMTGQAKGGALELDLITTPEPATLATLGASALLLRRRRPCRASSN